MWHVYLPSHYWFVVMLKWTCGKYIYLGLYICVFIWFHWFVCWIIPRAKLFWLFNFILSDETLDKFADCFSVENENTAVPTLALLLSVFPVSLLICKMRSLVQTYSFSIFKNCNFFHNNKWEILCYYWILPYLNIKKSDKIKSGCGNVQNMHLKTIFGITISSFLYFIFCFVLYFLEIHSGVVSYRSVIPIPLGW